MHLTLRAQKRCESRGGRPVLASVPNSPYALRWRKATFEGKGGLVQSSGALQSSSVQFSSRWYLCARKSPHALHPISQTFPQRCLWNGSNVRLTDDGPLSSFQGRSSSASSFNASLLEVIDGMMSLASCPQVVSQASQHFRPSEKQATCGGCFARQSVCSVVSLHSGMSRAVHPQEFSKVDVDHRHIPVWASHSTFHFYFLASSLNLWGWWRVWSGCRLLRQSSGGHGWLLPPPLSSWRLRPYRLLRLHGR